MTDIVDVQTCIHSVSRVQCVLIRLLVCSFWMFAMVCPLSSMCGRGFSNRKSCKNCDIFC